VPPAPGRFFMPAEEVDDETCLALGFPVWGGVAVRADEVEFLVTRLASGMRVQGLAQRLGCDLETAVAISDALAEPRRMRR
jgi:hypothetical protein